MYRAPARYFFMYLKKLYHQNKLWFLVVVVFAAAQLFINYKNGVEASPFYHYSMYSGPFTFLNEYDVVEVRVNGKRLQAKNFTPNQWDNMVMPVIQYEKEKSWNGSLYQNTIKRFLRVSDSSFYTNHFSRTDFLNWYEKRIRRLLSLQQTDNVNVEMVRYKQENKTFYRK